MRWLITGANGMLGRDLTSSLRGRSEEEVDARSKNDFDVTDSAVVRQIVDDSKPDVIVNCAAYTKVDDAEANEEAAMKINARSVANLAAAADAVGALLVQISTDFVFSGTKRLPYEPDDPTAPLSAYGRSKLLGEEYAEGAKKHLVIRTSWLFGIHGHNFVEAIRGQITKGNRQLRVVNDQHGRPTYTPHLAEAIYELVERSVVDPAVSGVIHYADEPACTWFDFAKEIAALAAPSGETIEVQPVTTETFPRPAHRPPYSVLSTDRYTEITGLAPSSWKEGLAEYFRLRR